MNKYIKLLNEAFSVMDFDSWDDTDQVFKEEITKSLSSMSISVQNIGIDKIYTAFPTEDELEKLRQDSQETGFILVPKGNCVNLILNRSWKEKNYSSREKANSDINTQLVKCLTENKQLNVLVVYYDYGVPEDWVADDGGISIYYIPREWVDEYTSEEYKSKNYGGSKIWGSYILPNHPNSAQRDIGSNFAISDKKWKSSTSARQRRRDDYFKESRGFVVISHIIFGEFYDSYGKAKPKIQWLYSYVAKDVTITNPGKIIDLFLNGSVNYNKLTYQFGKGVDDGGEIKSYKFTNTDITLEGNLAPNAEGYTKELSLYFPEVFSTAVRFGKNNINLEKAVTTVPTNIQLGDWTGDLNRSKWNDSAYSGIPIKVGGSRFILPSNGNNFTVILNPDSIYSLRLNGSGTIMPKLYFILGSCDRRESSGNGWNSFVSLKNCLHSLNRTLKYSSVFDNEMIVFIPLQDAENFVTSDENPNGDEYLQESLNNLVSKYYNNIRVKIETWGN